MDKFLKTYKLPKLTQKLIDYMNRPLRNWISRSKNYAQRKGPDDFNTELHLILKKRILHKLFQTRGGNTSSLIWWNQYHIKTKKKVKEKEKHKDQYDLWINIDTKIFDKILTNFKRIQDKFFSHRLGENIYKKTYLIKYYYLKYTKNS